MPNGSQQAYPPADPPPFHRAPIMTPMRSKAMPKPKPSTRTSLSRKRREPAAAAAGCSSWLRLVGAIGVGGALAYTYKSFVAPNGGRVPLVKADPNVKVRPDTRNATNDKRMQGRLGEDAGQQNTATAPETQDERSGSDDRRSAPRADHSHYARGRPSGRHPDRASRAGRSSAHHSRHHARHAKVPAASTASGAPAAATTGDHRSTTSTSCAAGRGTGCAKGARATAASRQGSDGAEGCASATGRQRSGQHRRGIRCRAVVAEDAHGCAQSVCRSAAEVW